jgi:FkbM family methyltransferase
MRLRENILINELNKVIETFQVALGAGEKNITINIVEKSPTGNAYIGDKNLFLETTTASYEVRMKKFDDFFVEKQIKNCDFIKIDVEGFEIDFLKGGLSIIKKFRPIILGEFNNWFIKQYGYDFEEVYELMLPLNYSFYIYKENKWQLFNGKKNNTDNLLLVPSERKEEVFC